MCENKDVEELRAIQAECIHDKTEWQVISVPVGEQFGRNCTELLYLKVCLRCAKILKTSIDKPE